MKRLFIFLIILTGCFDVLAQPPKEKPRLKEFGWSLEQEANKSDKNKRNEKAENNDDDIISVETNLVINDVFVTDKQGRVITGLKKEDFIVTEDGQRQTIETFALGNDKNIPRSIVLIIDYSISQLPYVETSIEAAKVLVDQLNPKDRMAIVTDDIELLTGFTDNKILLKEKLESLKTKALSGQVGRSEQYSALYAVLNEIFEKQDVRPIIFFQTDGDEDYALKDSGILSEAMLPERKFSFKDVLNAAEKTRPTIYPIIPGADFAGLSDSGQLQKARFDNESRRRIYDQIGKPVPPKMDNSLLRSSVKASLRRRSYMDMLATLTGGWTSMLETPEQAGSIYAKILSEINRRYVIGYYPTNEKRDGKRRTVKIEVRGHPDYVISGRKSYYTSQEKSK